MSEPLFDSYDHLANRTKAIMGDTVDFLDIESSQTQLGVPLSGRSVGANYDFGAVSELDQVSTYYIANAAVTSAKLAAGAAVANIGYTPGTGTMSSFTLAGDSGSSSITNGNTLTVSGSGTIATLVSGDQVTISDSATNANNSLSNLTSPTSINRSLIPATGAENLGSGSAWWNDIYFNDVYVNGTHGMADTVLHFNQASATTGDVHTMTTKRGIITAVTLTA